MAKIVSRTDTDTGRVTALQDLLIKHGNDIIGHPEDNPKVVVGQTFEECTNQIDQVYEGAKLALRKLAFAFDAQAIQLLMLKSELETIQDMLSKLVDDVDYDEALDHATMDLMDCFFSSGAAEATADGELAFDERVTFSKEDIKPMLREAIIRWIELRISK